MEKRRAGVTPLKKLTYEAKGEYNWWNESEVASLTQKRIDLIFGQMEEYKKLSEEAENERIRISRIKIDELSKAQGIEDAEKIAEKIIMNCQEHQQTITQLRKRLAQRKEENTPQKDRKEAPSEGIEEHIEKIEKLEEKIRLILRKYPPDYTKTVKALEQENRELSGTNTLLSKKIEGMLESERETQIEIEKIKESRETEERKTEEKLLQSKAEIEGLKGENTILKGRTDELYLAIETLNSTVVDKTRDLENHSVNREKCGNMCHERIQELENKEISRLEEVSFLVRKYIDTGKKNDALLLELTEVQGRMDRIEEKSKECERSQKIEQRKAQEEKTKYLEMIENQKIAIEKSKLEYLERKSSAQYHKRKAVQYESELHAAKKALHTLEELNSELQGRIDGLKKHKNTSKTQTDIELYQGMIRCNVCCTNIKNTALKRCMHLMCRNCIDARIAARQKTCPLCGTIFTPNDIASVYL